MKSVLRLVFMIILLFSISICQINAQEEGNENPHSIFLSSQFYQVKDAYNYGLVYNGFQLNLGYKFRAKTNSELFSYSTVIGFGASHDKGIGLNWTFKPIDIHKGWRIKNSDIYIGPYVSANYQWQLYPELQSGHMVWFSSYETGPRITATFPIGNKKISIEFSSAFTGFSSRPSFDIETHYYSLGISDFFKNVHHNLIFGSFNLFSHSEFKLMLKNKKGYAVSYGFEYFGYFKEPSIDFLAHSINISWFLGNKK